MKIQKKYVELMFNVISGATKDLSLKEQRVRDEQRGQLIEPLKSFYHDRTEIFEKFATEGADGKKKQVVDGKETYEIATEKQEEMAKEIEFFVNEEVEFNPAPELKDIIEKTSYETKAGETVMIDEFIKLL